MLEGRDRISVTLKDGTRKFIQFTGPAIIEAEKLLGRSIMSLFTGVSEDTILERFSFTELSNLVYAGMKGAGGTTSRSVVQQKMHTDVEHFLEYINQVYEALSLAIFGVSFEEAKRKAEAEAEEREASGEAEASLEDPPQEI